MKKYQIVLAFLLSGSFYLTIAQKSEVTSSKIEVKVDPGIELFSTIFRLAGLPEYYQNELPEYVNDIELYFNSFKDHPVVKFARQLDTTLIGVITDYLVEPPRESGLPSSCGGVVS